MAKSQDNDNTILLGLKGCVEEVAEEKERIIAAGSKDLDCPRSTLKGVYRHGIGNRRKVLHNWNKRNFIQL